MTQAERFVVTEKVHHQNFRHLFSDPRVVERLNDAVDRSHQIFETATHLLKLYSLETFSGLLPEIKTSSFDKSVATGFNAVIDINDATLYSTTLTVVSSDFTAKKKGRPFKDDALATHLESLYQRYAARGALPACKADGSNLSHVLSYMTTQLQTAYKNNVFLHFDKYIKRYVRQRIAETVIATLRKTCLDDLTKEQRRQLNKGINTTTRMLLFTETIDEDALADLVGDTLRVEFLCLLPARGRVRYFELKKQPGKFLPYMLHINLFLESRSLRVLSPNPFRSSFVTKHVTIDTAALVDIVVAPQGVPLAEVILRLEEGLGVPLRKKVGNINKGDLYGDPTKLVSTCDTNTFHAFFKRQLWVSLSNLGGTKTPTEWQTLTFNNLITTNGYKVDMHFTDAASFTRKRFTKGEHNVRHSEDDGFTYVHELSETQRSLILENDLKCLSADPGKGIVAYFSDGKRKKEGGRRLRYTATQRRFETSQKRNRAEMEKMLDVQDDAGGTYRQHVEALSSPDASGKSSSLRRFETYLVLRLRVTATLRPFYQRRSHRRRQYRALLGRRSSEDRLITNLRKTFGEEQAVILWGNWGRNPNIKHQPPTPGIGLRRAVHKAFTTYTVDERWTSSRCFSCEGRVGHPKTRRYWKKNRLGIHVQVDVEIHHLLRCENEKCTSRWWHRDNLGSLNIMKNGVHGLQHGKTHPCFLPQTPKSRPISRKGTQVTQSSTKPVSRRNKRFIAPVLLPGQGRGSQVGGVFT